MFSTDWCFWTVMLEKTLESSLDCKEIQPVNFKGNQSWIFIGRTDAEAEAPVLWPPDLKNWLKKWLTGKDPDAGKDWRQQEKGVTEDEIVAWHHWLNGYEFKRAPGVGDGQGSLACCSPWGHKESDTTEWLNWCFQLSLPFRSPRCNVQLIFPTGATYEHVLLLTAYSSGASCPKLKYYLLPKPSLFPSTLIIFVAQYHNERVSTLMQSFIPPSSANTRFLV